MTDYYRVEEPLLTKKVILVPKVAYLFRLCSAAIGVGLGVIATVVFSGAVVRPPSSPLPHLTLDLQSDAASPHSRACSLFDP